jgi:5-methylcytosine-specific restriction endonuclease McrA
MKTKQCAVCGTPFPVKYVSLPKKTCSEECRNVLLARGRQGKKFPGIGGSPRRSPTEAVCIVCEKVFLLTMPEAHNRKKTCSEECLRQFKSETARKQHTKNRKEKPVKAVIGEVKEPITIICIICNKVFTINRQTKIRKTCSALCTNELHRRNTQKRYTKQTRTCEGCGKEYKIGQYELRKGNRFCSDECRKKWFAQQTPTGENNPYWRGGYREYYGPSWRSARRAVLKRDNYSCQTCGKHKDELGENPVVHHKIPFKLYGVERHEEANRVENLICHCRSCHMQIEWAMHARTRRKTTHAQIP